MNNKLSIIETEVVNRIFFIRGHKVIFDFDLASMYGVETKRLKESVKRNIKRFPEDFMFQLTKEEVTNLRSQIASSSWGGQRYLPFVFTEQGVAMLSGILNSDRAIKVNIAIMRAFVQLRILIDSNKGLAKKIEDMEQKYDAQFQIVFEAIKQLISKKNEPRTLIGFKKYNK